MAFSAGKTVLFIDGPNLFASAATLNTQEMYRVDFTKLLKLFRGTVRAYYYTALPPPGEPSTLRPLIDHLSYNGYNIRTKSTKTWKNNDGTTKVKGNMDIEMVMDMVDMCNAGVSEMVLFTGDGDFQSAIEWLQKRGVIVTVVSAMSLVADELRRSPDVFIDIADIADKIVREDDFEGMEDKTSRQSSARRR